MPRDIISVDNDAFTVTYAETIRPYSECERGIKMVKSLTMILVLVGAGLAPNIASAAEQTCAPVVVPAGQRRCCDMPTVGQRNASVNDFVMSGHKVKFVFLGKPTGSPEFTEIGNSGTNPVSSYARSITSATDKPFFPGTFRTCANNQSDKSSTVSLKLAVDK